MWGGINLYPEKYDKPQGCDSQDSEMGNIAHITSGNVMYCVHYYT